jgi:hypothetical protein
MQGWSGAAEDWYNLVIFGRPRSVGPQSGAGSMSQDEKDDDKHPDKPASASMAS